MEEQLKNPAITPGEAGPTIPTSSPRRRWAMPAGDRVLGRRAAPPQLPDPAQDEHVVVHAQPEQQDEHEHRQPRRDPPVGA